MKSHTGVFFNAFVFIVVMNTSLVFAQHNHSGPQGASPDMMQKCQKHHSEMSTLVDQMSKTLADGREQNNLETMRAAIDKAQSQLGEVKHHMSMCPMAKDGMMHDSSGHTKGMKCTSDQQNSDGKDQTSE